MTMAPAMGKVSYNPTKVYAPISQILELEQYIVVRSDFPAKTIEELVFY